MWNIMVKNIDGIFSHFSNILICGAIFLGAEITLKYPEHVIGGEISATIIALILILTSFFLFSLNACHGIRKFYAAIDKIEKPEEFQYLPRFIKNIFGIYLGIFYGLACIQIMFSAAQELGK